MPWGNCWSLTSPLKVKSKMKISPTLCLGGLGCMASSTLYHTLSWLRCCHTIPAAAETRVPGKNPHRKYMIATLGSVAVTTPGKLPSCSVSQSAYRRWESCLVLEFQASAKQCSGMYLCFFLRKHSKIQNFIIFTVVFRIHIFLACNLLRAAEAEVVEQHHLRGYELAVQKARRAENRLLVLSSAPRNQCLVPEHFDIASRLAIGQIGCCVDGCSLGFGLHFDLHSHCAGLTSSSFLSKHSAWKLW